MPYKANLDSNGIYFGVIETESLLDGDIEVPQECDLAPGHYQWDANQNTFVPLAVENHKNAPDSPMGERALYELIKSLPNPPPYCMEWAAWYERTLDMKGAK